MLEPDADMKKLVEDIKADTERILNEPMDTKLRTSEEWQLLKPAIRILDPDGWDRKNFHYSWHEELIDEMEYTRRLMQSTVEMHR